MLEHPDYLACVKGVPRILGLKYTETVAELKMEHCGVSLQKFINTDEFADFEPFHKACIALDLMRQVLVPLKIVHGAHFVHGDIKPDNICIKPREKPEESLLNGMGMNGVEY
jgi:serine/threonine protein kinase